MTLPPLLASNGYTHDMNGAVTLTGRHRNTISQAAARGLIPGAIKSGGQWFFKELGLLIWQGIPADDHREEVSA
jgi:hypothetical protein